MKSNRIYALSLCIFVMILCALFSLGVFAVGEGEFRTAPAQTETKEETFLLKLSVSPENRGSISVKIDGKEVADLNIKKGASVTLSASAKEGFAFDYWDGVEGTGISETQQTQPEINFSMESDLTVTAHFKEHKTKYTVFIETNDESMGSGNFGYRDFAPGETVKVGATASPGFKFVRWTDANSTLSGSALEEGWETKSEFSFTMPAKDVYLSIEFDYVTYYFTLKIKGQGEVEVSGKEKNKQGKYECTVGEEILLSAVPGEDYVFVNWSGTNSAEFSDFDKTDTALICPASDFTVTANFASSVRTLTLEASEGGTIHPEPGEMAMGVDTILSLTATPLEGYAFSHWECTSSEGSFENAKDAETDFTMPDEDCTVKAVFVKGGYRLTLSASAGGKAEGEEGVYEMGAKVTVKATPLKGYVFSRWQSSVSGVIASPENATSEIVIPGEDVKITAVFVLETSFVPGASHADDIDDSSFPWGIMIAVFFVSAIAITLVIIRERFNLSYRYLIKKWLTKNK